MANSTTSTPSPAPDDPLLKDIPDDCRESAKWILNHLRDGQRLVRRERWFFDGLMALRHAGIVRVQIQPDRRFYAAWFVGGCK